MCSKLQSSNLRHNTYQHVLQMLQLATTDAKRVRCVNAPRLFDQRHPHLIVLHACCIHHSVGASHTKIIIDDDIGEISFHVEEQAIDLKGFKFLSRFCRVFSPKVVWCLFLPEAPGRRRPCRSARRLDGQSACDWLQPQPELQACSNLHICLDPEKVLREIALHSLSSESVKKFPYRSWSHGAFWGHFVSAKNIQESTSLPPAPSMVNCPSAQTSKLRMLQQCNIIQKIYKYFLAKFSRHVLSFLTCRFAWKCLDSFWTTFPLAMLHSLYA